MILQTGMRTDIPAFYAQWFLNRLRAGFVDVRNPYNPHAVTRYRITPDVVDLIGFCTKNPAPMLPHLNALSRFGQYWFITITPYGRDIEPNVPPAARVIEDFRRLSDVVGPDSMGWRYDPILIDSSYTAERHIDAFDRMAKALSGATHTAVISFIDLYSKVRRNFPEAREVSAELRLKLGGAMAEIAKANGMTLRPCGEGSELAAFGADCSGCMTAAVFERALGRRLNVPAQARRGARKDCACLLSADIGAYNSCPHLCRYCYANADAAKVRANFRMHDPESSMLIGRLTDQDTVHMADQRSWLDDRVALDLSAAP